MLYVNGKAIFGSPEGDINLFDIIAEILDGRYIIAIYIYKMHRFCNSTIYKSKEKNEARSRKYSTEIITLNTNYADDPKAFRKYTRQINIC